MYEAKLNISRIIMRLEVGQSEKMRLTDVTFDQAQAEAIKFAKRRRRGVECQKIDGGMAITRIEFSDHTVQYAEIDRLAVGQSTLIKMPPAFHHRVRLAASNRNRLNGWALSCAREGDDIRVTRLPAAGDSTGAEIQPPQRTTKYGLDRLATGETIKFDLPRAEHHKVRMAVSTKARITGWSIRCRVQDDGTLQVYRVDLPDADSSTSATSTIA